MFVLRIEAEPSHRFQQNLPLFFFTQVIRKKKIKFKVSNYFD